MKGKRYNPITRQYAQQKEKELEQLDERIHPDDKTRGRDEFSRDFARIIYCSSFRRLQGKMQLLGTNHLHFFRNRLTHSLEVAQIARSTAIQLGLKHSIVAESCALAHDLGNPPFGHYGEKVLNTLANNVGGFEGNAQTLRILTTLEKKHYAYRGLNLTLRTLLGVIKYHPLSYNQPNKFIYPDDLQWIQDSVIDTYKLSEIKTIDMQIMDLSDEIAYAAHDLEDCLSIGYFTIDELLYEFKVSEKYRSAYPKFEKIVKKCQHFAGKAKNFKTSEEFSFLFRKELTSVIVNILINDISYSDEHRRLDFDEYKDLAAGLKKLVFSCILRKRSVQLYEKRGEKIIKGLFEVYRDNEYNKNLSLLPPEYRDENHKERSIIDYIAGMMDSYAIEEYKRHFGPNSLDTLYPTDIRFE